MKKLIIVIVFLGALGVGAWYCMATKISVTNLSGHTIENVTLVFNNRKLPPFSPFKIGKLDHRQKITLPISTHGSVVLSFEGAGSKKVTEKIGLVNGKDSFSFVIGEQDDVQIAHNS